MLVRVSDPASALVLGIDWAFGAGDQAVTFVGKSEPDTYLEHYFTYYSRIRQMGVTPGQETWQARNVADAAGATHKGTDILNCFLCHSTGTLKVVNGNIQPNELGVRCEACHGPGSAHEASGGKVAMGNPAQLPAAELNTFCGRCHRTPPTKDQIADWSNPWNVRFAPAYLSRSACFQKSNGKLSCLSCHGPHEAVVEDRPDSYNRVCNSCHTAVHRKAEMSDCISCHMPRVSPNKGLTFTNHWIAKYSKVQP